MVSLYEEQEALRYANYNPDEWAQLSWQSKAVAVAHFRNHRLVELHVQDAVSIKQEADSKRKTPARRK